MSDVLRRALAIVVLLVAVYIVFKLVLGLVSFVVWIGIAVVAVVATVWAVRQV
jgi:hypothetical protein